MLLEVKNRSPEAWGPLAKLTDTEFNRIINNTTGNTKDLIKKFNKLKTYKVTFQKITNTDQFEIQAENDYDVGSAARDYFKANADKIEFKEQESSKWADSYRGYDNIRYVKVK